MFNDTKELIKTLFEELFSFLINIFKYFKDFSVYIFDKIVNGENYKYYISFILILFGLLIYLFLKSNYFIPLEKDNEINNLKRKIEESNHYNEKYEYRYKIQDIYKNLSNNIKFTELGVLLSGGILLTLFYYFVYRKYNSYNVFSNKISLIEKNNQSNSSQTSENSKNSESFKRKYYFDKENFNFSIVNPILNLLISLLYILGTTLLPIFIITIVFITFKNKKEYYSIFKLILFFIILITSLAIIAYALGIHKNDSCIKYNDLKGIKLIMCIIKELIFFIPCLLAIFVEKLNNDIKLTPSPVYILFFILIFFILMTFLLPLVYKFFINLNKNRLLDTTEPVYLNKKQTIGKFQHLRDEKNKLLSSGSSFNVFERSEDQDYNLEVSLNGKPKLYPYNYSYSISFYLYLNPQDINTSFSYNKEEGAELFNYGCKPLILYNGKTQQIIIKSKNIDNNDCTQSDIIFKSKDKKYGNFDFKFQKWVYFVINYENNIIDIFIDGILVSSKKNIPNFEDNDKITIGEDNGIHGSIKDIYYNKIKQSEFEINFFKNLLNN